MGRMITILMICFCSYGFAVELETTVVRNGITFVQKELIIDQGEGSLRPMALVKGDFDEDGVPDLVAGYGDSARGVLYLFRGNVDSIYPNNPEAKKRKAAGQFVNSPFLPNPEQIEITNAFELLAARDFNNDGHLDLVTAIPDKSVILHAGDGTNKFGLATEIAKSTNLFDGMATQSDPNEVSRIAMRLNKDAVDDFVVLKMDGTLQVELSAPMAIFVVNSTADPGTGTCDTTECTLREAIIATNANPGLDEIDFIIPGVGPHTISTISLLLLTNDPVTIDATTEPDYAGNPIVELDGTNAGFVDGIFVGGGSSVIRGLVINRFIGDGIAMQPPGNNIIEGNFIGTDITGTVAFSNDDGVFNTNASNITIGGTASGSRNVISGNRSHGVVITGQSSVFNVIEGNFIGTDVTGTLDLGNTLNGVFINNSPANRIGGIAPGSRNIISGNGDNGVTINSATDNLVQSNFIGTDVTGTVALGNSSSGVFIFDTSGNTVGGTSAGAGNVISGNGDAGLSISGPEVGGTIVQGNFIGTDVSGTLELGNVGSGISTGGSLPGLTTIGGTSGSAGNVIAFNGGYAVCGNPLAVRRNSIFSNAGLGIDVGCDGITPNDIPDVNGKPNFPVLTSADSAGGNIAIQGTLTSFPSSVFTLEFFSSPTCDSSGNGEGQTFIGTTNVVTDVSGNVVFTVTFPVSLSAGQSVTATATNSSNTTSEFSACIEVTGSACPTITVSPASVPDGVVGVSYGQTFTASGGTAPYTFAVSIGSLPSGLSLASDGNLSGTPSAEGTFNFTITATDDNGCTGNRSYTISITTPLFLLFDNFQDGVVSWGVKKGTCEEIGDALVCTGSGNATVFAPVPWNPSGDLACSTCTIETEIQTAGGAFSKVIVQGWYQNNNDRVELIINEETDKWTLKQHSGGVVVAKDSFKFPIEPGVNYVVQLSFDGTNFHVSVNGAFALAMQAGALPTGNVGYKVKRTVATFYEMRVF